jgi:uncharacterized protein (TIGR00266 family)
MKIEFQYKPGSTLAKVSLDANETITAEGGAMIAMSPNLKIETTTAQKKGGGGILSGVKRMFSSESFFFNHFTANNGAGEIYLGTSLPGDMEVLQLNNKKIYVEGGSYVASSAGVSMNTAWQGAKNFISGESLFWVELSGEGEALINAFGVIYPIDIDGEYIVDTGHIVAYEDGMNFTISKAGSSWLASFLGGEGFVCKFSGKGRVWCQSHSSSAWGSAMRPHLKAIKK